MGFTPLEGSSENPLLMGFFPPGGGYDIHPSTCPANGIFPTQRRPQESPVDRISLLEGGYDIHPSIHPTDEIPLLGGRNAIPSLREFPPLGGSCMYIPLMGFFLLESVNAELPTGFSR